MLLQAMESSEQLAKPDTEWRELGARKLRLTWIWLRYLEGQGDYEVCVHML